MVAVVDDKCLYQGAVFIDDMSFSQISREIESIIENIMDGLVLCEELGKQHAKIIANEIEPGEEPISGAQFVSDANIPPVSIKIIENLSSFRVEWQRNRIVMNNRGNFHSVQRKPIRMVSGRLRYSSSIFNAIDLEIRQKFILAEKSLAKIRRQQALLAEIRRLLRRLGYAAKGVVPLEDALSPDSTTEHR